MVTYRHAARGAYRHHRSTLLHALGPGKSKAAAQERPFGLVPMPIGQSDGMWSLVPMGHTFVG